MLVLSAVWLWVGVAFLALRYATINFAAKYAAWAFVAEAALLAWAGWRGRFDPPAGLARRVGIGLVVFAVLLEPLSAPLLGRPLRQLELFGLTPDPTRSRRSERSWRCGREEGGLLMIVPVLWCVLTGLTLLAMSAKDWWIAPAAGAAAIAFSVSSRAKRGIPFDDEVASR
jgi:multidrug transporter EmrE-like cation transporter